jgi:hypothetical protein
MILGSSKKQGLPVLFIRWQALVNSDDVRKFLAYLIIAAPAVAQTPSWSLVSPETPTAPMILPSARMGTPPSTGTAPSRPSTRTPAPPDAKLSWKAFVGRLNNAAERAFVVDELTVWIDDGNSHCPFIFHGLSQRGSGDFFRTLHADGWTVRIGKHL